jgi:lipoprotein-anchoring transpeptidase ErfK/SrfK
MSKRLSRRDFIKLGALGLTGLAFRPYLKNTIYPDPERTGDIVRVATYSVSVYKEPNDKSQILFQHYQDELVNVYYKLVSPDGPAYNPIWYRVWGGYMHSAHLEEVHTQLNPIVYSFPDTGIITEVTVPYTQAYLKTETGDWETVYRLYYGSTHWVRSVEEGPDGRPWYKIEDEMDDHYIYYVAAPHLRPVPDWELTPLSTNVPPEDKLIIVSISEQTLTAYEGSEVVMHTKISSGIPSRRVAGKIPTDTPTGDNFHVSSKMPSKHMGNGVLHAEKIDSNGVPQYEYEIPGVPWTSFFEPLTGVAFHGTYWHSNFGTPMSHGCVNMRTDEAKWIFRWTTPVWEPGVWEQRGYGTRVIVR